MILVMAGTSDGKVIASELGKRFPVVASATTPYGRKLLEEVGVQVVMDKMDVPMLVSFIKDRGITLLIDATHPYAENGTKNAIIASEEANITYARYERPSSDTVASEEMMDYQTCLDKLRRSSGNILLTVGSNNLDLFCEKGIVKRVFPRVLPTSSVIRKCEELGYDTGKIIAMKGPFSTAMNSLMIREMDIKFLITKESSSAGGFEEKVSAARECGIELMVIKRPKVDMKNVFDDFEEVYRFVEEVYKV